jgi:hypothetical protein
MQPRTREEKRMSRKLRLPSPALAVALAALFVALSGTAVAAGVPALAKRALTADKAKVADNAKKLGGQTSAQLLATANTAAKAAATAAGTAAAQQPGPASTAVGLVTIKTASAGQMPPGNAIRTIGIACDAGQKVIGGGMSSDGVIVTFDSYPNTDASWEVVIGNLGGGTANVNVYAICLK